MRQRDISYMPDEAIQNAVEQVRGRRNLKMGGAVMKSRGGTFKGIF